MSPAQMRAIVALAKAKAKAAGANALLSSVRAGDRFRVVSGFGEVLAWRVASATVACKRGYFRVECACGEVVHLHGSTCVEVSRGIEGA